MMRNLSRRDFIALTGLTLATGLMGCSKDTPSAPFDFSPYRDLEEDHVVILCPDGSSEEYTVRDFGALILNSKNDEVSLKAKLNDARLIASGRVMQTDDDVFNNENGLKAEAGVHICSGDEGNKSEFFFVYSKDKILNDGIKPGALVLATSVMKDKTYRLNFSKTIDSDYHHNQRVTFTGDAEIEVLS